jgi:hypothetical protein
LAKSDAQRNNLASRGVIDNPYAVLGSVFLALAIFGVPLIWMCRAWTPSTKVVLTIITLLYTALLLWLFYLVMVWSWSRISPVFH